MRKEGAQISVISYHRRLVQERSSWGTASCVIRQLNDPVCNLLRYQADWASWFFWVFSDCQFGQYFSIFLSMLCCSVGRGGRGWTVPIGPWPPCRGTFLLRGTLDVFPQGLPSQRRQATEHLWGRVVQSGAVAARDAPTALRDAVVLGSGGRMCRCVIPPPDRQIHPPEIPSLFFV